MQIALAQVGAIDVSPNGSVKSETQKRAAKDVHLTAATAVTAVTCFMSIYLVLSFHCKSSLDLWMRQDEQ